MSVNIQNVALDNAGNVPVAPVNERESLKHHFLLPTGWGARGGGRVQTISQCGGQQRTERGEPRGVLRSRNGRNRFVSPSLWVITGDPSPDFRGPVGRVRQEGGMRAKESRVRPQESLKQCPCPAIHGHGTVSSESRVSLPGPSDAIRWPMRGIRQEAWNACLFVGRLNREVLRLLEPLPSNRNPGQAQWR